MQRETAADYRWAVHHLRDVFKEYNLLTNNVIFVTDHELALMGALDDTFPTANMLLCRWYINKNTLAKHKAGSSRSIGGIYEGMVCSDQCHHR